MGENFGKNCLKINKKKLQKFYSGKGILMIHMNQTTYSTKQEKLMRMVESSRKESKSKSDELQKKQVEYEEV